MAAYRTKIFFIVIFLYCSPIFGQERTDLLLNKKITITKNRVRLDSLFKIVNQQTGLIFSYNARKVKHDFVLNLLPKSYSLNEILLKIKETTGLDYSLAENHIILKSPKSIVAQTNSSSKENNPKSEIKNEEPKKINTIPYESKKEKTDSLIEESDSIKIISHEKSIENLTEIGTDSLKNIPSTKMEQEKPKQDSIPKSIQDKETKNEKLAIINKNPKPNKIKKFPFQSKVGLSADETLYFGPTVQLGIPQFFATASYKTNFSLSLFSYGLGTSFRINENLRMIIFINTGTVNKNYQFKTFESKIEIDSLNVVDTVTTTIINAVVAKSRLSRVGIMLEKNITSKISIQAGIQFNSLNTNYVVNGTSSSIGFLGNDADKKVHTFLPPYLISNSYKSTSDSNVKNWIGIQLNVLYTINFSKKK